jgi:hypothetical protein
MFQIRQTATLVECVDQICARNKKMRQYYPVLKILFSEPVFPLSFSFYQQLLGLYHKRPTAASSKEEVNSSGE